MQVAPEISFHDMEKSDWIEDYVRQRIAKLERFNDDIIACRTVIERAQHHSNTGNPYRVRVEVTIPPRKELVGDKSGQVADSHVQMRPVIRQAFEAVEKQLKKESAKRRGDVKRHEQVPRAMVVELNRELGYGVIEDHDGRDYHFNRGAVLHDDFDRLTEGTEVRFEPDPGNDDADTELGDEALRASTVQIINKPRGNISQA